MLIKQSQDEGGDEITWKVSPVNERLKVLTSKQLLRPIASTLHPCSEIQSYSSSVGKLEKWLSSPFTTTLDKSLTSSRSVSFAETEVGMGRASNGLFQYLDMDGFKSAFRTPPSLSCGPNQLSSSVSDNGVQYRKQLIELLDQVEDAITEDSEPATLNLSEDHAATNVNIGIQNNPMQGNAIYSSKKADHDLKNDGFLVLEVCEKHKNTESKSTQNPFKVLRLLN